MNCLPLPPGAETRLLIVDSEALTSVPAVLAEYFPGCRPWLVADDNTFAAAGSRLLAELKSSGAAPDRRGEKRLKIIASVSLHIENPITTV